MFGLLLLVGVLSAIVFGILGTGAAIASSISAATGTSPLGGLMGTLGGLGGLGRHASAYGLGADAAGGGFDYRSMAYLGAYGFGNGLLFAIGLVIPFLTFVNGTCLIYLQTVSGVDFSATEAEPARRGRETPRRTGTRTRRRSPCESTRLACRQRGERSGDGFAAGIRCGLARRGRDHGLCAVPQPMAADDLFCGECGARRHA